MMNSRHFKKIFYGKQQKLALDLSKKYDGCISRKFLLCQCYLEIKLNSAQSCEHIQPFKKNI